jgi:hypothetical protein
VRKSEAANVSVGSKAERLAATIFRPDYPQEADIVDALWHFRFVPILLQKSKVAGLKILGENITQRAIADSYDLNRVTVVACEFCVRP